MEHGGWQLTIYLLHRKPICDFLLEEPSAWIVMCGGGEGTPRCPCSQGHSSAFGSYYMSTRGRGRVCGGAGPKGQALMASELPLAPVHHLPCRAIHWVLSHVLSSVFSMNQQTRGHSRRNQSLQS